MEHLYNIDAYTHGGSKCISGPIDLLTTQRGARPRDVKDVRYRGSDTRHDKAWPTAESGEQGEHDTAGRYMQRIVMPQSQVTFLTRCIH